MNQTSMVRLCHVSLTLKKYKSTKTDPLSLASALGLLSPLRDITKSTAYKPSLFRSLQRGSVSEEYAEIKNQPPISFDGPRAVHQKLIASLMADLHHATGFVPRSREPIANKNLKAHVRTLTNEAELLDLLRSLYLERSLTLPLLMHFLLNRHLRDLSKFPFDVASIDRGEFSKHGWSISNFSELKILLMKKYHDLQQPLEIIKILKHSFHPEFLPLIQKYEILPFYERIVWKFYFEYIGLGQESATIKLLESLRSSLLIWEATTNRNCEVLSQIVQQHKLNTPQLLFFKVASCALVQNSIEVQLAHGNSALLSGLKQISGKLKIYKASEESDVMGRAYTFSLIHKLENLLETHFPSLEAPELKALFAELRAKREHMIKPQALETGPDILALYAH